MSDHFIYVAPLLCGESFKVGVSKQPEERLTWLSQYYSFAWGRCVAYSSPTELFHVERMIHKHWEDFSIAYPYDGGTEFLRVECLGAVRQMLDSLNMPGAIITTPDELPLPLEEQELLAARVAHAIRTRRLLLNISQTTAAQMSKVSKRTVERIEAGDNVNVSALYSVVQSIGVPLFDESVFKDMYKGLRQRAASQPTEEEIHLRERQLFA